MDMVKCILKLKSMPHSFWAETTACAIYMLNRCSTRNLSDKMLEDRRPFVSRLRIFGGIAYSHIPNELMKKFDDEGEKCIFTGYSEMSRVYKLFNTVSGKVIVSRDMTSDERGVSDLINENPKNAELTLNFDKEEKHVDI